MKKNKSRLDYVEYYAELLRTDNSIFEQHKKFIESQYDASKSLFQNMFGKGKEFKINARKYLRQRGLI